MLATRRSAELTGRMPVVDQHSIAGVFEKARKGKSRHDLWLILMIHPKMFNDTLISVALHETRSPVVSVLEVVDRGVFFVGIDEIDEMLTDSKSPVPLASATWSVCRP